MNRFLFIDFTAVNCSCVTLLTDKRLLSVTCLFGITAGMQGDSLVAAEPRGLPPGKILPQYLKDLGYTTRAVGKWHLGFYKREVTPTYRGFDSHLGYWNDYVSYYDYILQERVNTPSNSTSPK
jgi:arylsulfatase A-like enzyme